MGCYRVAGGNSSLRTARRDGANESGHPAHSRRDAAAVVSTHRAGAVRPSSVDSGFRGGVSGSCLTVGVRVHLPRGRPVVLVELTAVEQRLKAVLEV